MTFSELFCDYIHQYENEYGYPARPIYTGESRLSLAELATGSVPSSIPVPEPTSLGDLMKLFQGPVLQLKSISSVPVPQFRTPGNDKSYTLLHPDQRPKCGAYRVKVKSVSIPDTLMELIALILKTIFYSERVWHSSMNEHHTSNNVSKLCKIKMNTLTLHL